MNLSIHPARAIYEELPPFVVKTAGSSCHQLTLEGDIEAVRDAILAVAGDLDLRAGGPATKLTDENKRRTVYAYINRSKPDPTLELFHFPNPNNTIEQPSVTLGPLQRQWI